MYKKICPVCTREFKTYHIRQKFCCRPCKDRYFARIAAKCGSIKVFKAWLNVGLITWDDFNEFKI